MVLGKTWRPNTATNPYRRLAALYIGKINRKWHILKHMVEPVPHTKPRTSQRCQCHLQTPKEHPVEGLDESVGIYPRGRLRNQLALSRCD